MKTFWQYRRDSEHGVVTTEATLRMAHDVAPPNLVPTLGNGDPARPDFLRNAPHQILIWIPESILREGEPTERWRSARTDGTDLNVRLRDAQPNKGWWARVDRNDATLTMTLNWPNQGTTHRCADPLERAYLEPIISLANKELSQAA